MKIIHHVVDLDVPVTAVWSAITEEPGLAGWWTPSVQAPSAEVGGRIEFTLTAEFSPVMEIIRADEDSELAWKCIGGHEPWNDSTFRFHLSLLGDGRVRLRFWQEYAIELDDDAYGSYNFRWGYYLNSLRQFCTTGEGTPFERASDQ